MTYERWAVVSEKGKIDIDSLREFDFQAIDAFVNTVCSTWEFWEKHGFTCKKVRVTIEVID